MVPTCRRIAESKIFQRFILLVILAAGVVVGLETYPDILQRHGALLHALDQIILGIFAVEITIKFGSHGSKFWRFFKDPWNVFDFIIVAVCFLPLRAQFAAALRLARILRVLRLVTTLPRLQILVGTLLKSIPSMGYVALLLFLLFYMYAIMGTFLFGRNDPLHFGSLQTSMLSLFQVVTLEGWVELLDIQREGSAHSGYVGKEHLIVESSASPVIAVLYFVSFILVGTMIMLNLLIGVIMSGMEETQAETALAARLKHQRETGAPTLGDDLTQMEEQLDELKKRLNLIRHRVECSDAKRG